MQKYTTQIVGRVEAACLAIALEVMALVAGPAPDHPQKRITDDTGHGGGAHGAEPGRGQKAGCAPASARSSLTRTEGPTSRVAIGGED